MAERRAIARRKAHEEAQKKAMAGLGQTMNVTALIQAAKFAQVVDSVEVLRSGLPADELPEEVCGGDGRTYGGKALCGLRPGFWPRKEAILLCEAPYFDQLILATILANCATMAWESPRDPPGTLKASFIGLCEWVFLAIFTVEMLTKMLAYGLVVYKESYLRDAWCQVPRLVSPSCCLTQSRVVAHM